MRFCQTVRRSAIAEVVVLLLALHAVAGEPFTEEASVRGVDYVPVFGGDAGSGVALVDLDGDGDADLVVTGAADGHIGVYENNGLGVFTDRSENSGIPQLLPSEASAVIAGDYDSDGDLDLYFANKDTADVLVRNDGDFQFTDVSNSAGLGVGGFGTGSAWADYDNDGLIDLYVAILHNDSKAPPNQLYHNLGDGLFEEVAAELGVADSNKTWQAVFFDFDRDSDADLYISNDKGYFNCEIAGNHLFENVGGTFVEITEQSGTAACIDSMGVAVGDFDGNGFQDLYCTNIPYGNPLFLNQGDGTFVDAMVEAGVGSYAVGWGAHFFDFDNDGIQDLYVCNANAANRLYRHDGKWPCVDVAEQMGVADDGASFCMAVADIDGDGDLDIVLQNDGDPIRLFINHEGETRRWAKFDIVGEGQSRYPIGANVDVRVGPVWMMRELAAGGNFKSQNELIVHFGLDQAVMMDEVRVVWPGGATRTLYNLPTNQTWTLVPTDKLGDGDHDGDHDIDDFVIFAGCYDMPFAPGCEMMDFDGSGAVDLGDFEAFLGVYDDTPADCNDNGTPDMEEILLDPLLDQDGDGELDKCDCPEDLDGSGDVEPFDLALLLGAWGPCDDCPADVNGDGQVGPFDLALLLGAWGPCE